MIDKKVIENFLRSNGLDAMLLSNQSDIAHLTSFHSFSPTERDAFALVTAKDRFLFTNPLYITEVRESVKNVEIIEHSGENNFFKNLAEIVAKNRLHNIGFENDNITVAEYLRLTTAITSHLIAKDFSQVRIQKSPAEIESITQACEIGDNSFELIKPFLKPGITELGLAWELEKRIRESGAELSFPTIVAFGANSAMPHHLPNSTKLNTRDTVLLDFGSKTDGYCSDMSRTLFIGEPTKQQKSVYEAVLQAQREAVNFLQKELRIINKDGIKASDVDKVAREYLVSKGYPSIPHSLGHGIGLDVHEAPRISPSSHDYLSEGMVFSIEPGVYLEGKFGVRIEDLYSIQDNKLIQLTHSAV